MIAKVESAAYLGVQAYPVEIEVDVANGLPQMTVVGLPDPSVKESRERVRSAIKNSGFDFPLEKITVNLAPADIKKEGPAFDLAIALGILAANGALPAEKLAGYLFLGELALDGSLRPIRGAAVMTSSFKNSRAVVLPAENAKEASLEKNAAIYPVTNLRETVDFLTGEKEIAPFPVSSSFETFAAPPSSVDFSEIKGQAAAKRAVEIAVAGSHNILLIGPPGSGKTMLARRIPTILPPLHFEESIEMTKIHSVAGLTANWTLIQERPFRAPHHSISQAALAGGGSWPMPGEISLAHGGVLFLDEFPEFRRDALETLRGPMEEGEITIARAKMRVAYPARTMLVAAMNPCPCGYLRDRQRKCRCSLGQIQKYQSKVSGPILDRIDIHVEVSCLPFQTLVSEESAESSGVIRERIMACRDIQSKRYGTGKLNATIRAREIREHARPNEEGRKLLEMAMKELRLSARAYYKILKIARTIADLAEEKNISAEHIAEAIQYRSLDREWRV